jgi:glycosyltransferase involved in cell wall biosynthesis
MPMRFVFVSHNFSSDINSPEDWFRRIKIYTGSLSLLSLTNTVIRIERINYRGSCLHEGIEYHFEDFGKGKLHFPWKLDRQVSHLKPDVVVVSGLHYPLQVMQLRMHLGKRVKIIAQNHAEKPFTGIKKYWQRLADRSIDAYLFASKSMGEEWVKRGNLGDRSKIHEVMEVSSAFYPMKREEARAETASNGKPIFLWVGRLDRNKNPLLVVNAFLRFLDNCSGARLYMIFHQENLLLEIEEILDKESTKRDAIVLVGSVTHDQLLFWYNSADFFISGSWYEGSGAAVCEAMSCGVIPILTDIFSFDMMTARGSCGLLYPPGDSEALLLALRKAAGMDLEKEKSKVLEQFKSNLSFEAIARKIQTLAGSLGSNNSII